MMLSFIVPYHNEPVTMLRDLLAGIAETACGVTDFEVLVIDDGSDVPLSLQADGVRVVRQEAAGLSAARNRGLSLAVGDYVQFVDADDKLLSDYSKVLDLALRGAADIIMFRHTRTLKAAPADDPEKGFRTVADCSGPEFLNRYNLRASACGYIFRKDIADGLSFAEGLYHEDELFTPQLFLRAARVLDTETVAYYYRRRNDSITTASGSDRVRRRLDDMEKVIGRLAGLAEKDAPDLTRRVRQLTMDYVYKMYADGIGRRDRRQRIARLRRSGLFPLPVTGYSCKYAAFSLLSHIYL